MYLYVYVFIYYEEFSLCDLEDGGSPPNCHLQARDPEELLKVNSNLSAGKEPYPTSKKQLGREQIPFSYSAFLFYSDL